MKLSELLDRPEKWTKGWYAKTATGERVNNSSDPSACCWCLLGAIERCEPKRDPFERVFLALHSAMTELFPERCNIGEGAGYIDIFNDHPETTFDDVRRVIERAEQILEGKNGER